MGDNKPKRSWWWLSFVSRPVAGDTHQGKWLGGCAVEATDLHDAVAQAWKFNCNPGGEVMGWPPDDPDYVPPLEVQYRLCTDEAELQKLLGKLIKVSSKGAKCIDCEKESS